MEQITQAHAQATDEQQVTQSLPDWLAPSAIHSTIQSDSQVVPSALVDPQVRRQISKQALDVAFESMFERVLDEIVRGRTLKAILDSDVRTIDYDAFFRWIKRDPQRFGRYKEAKELRTEWWAGRLIEIAEADDTLEDVQRSKLKIDTYKWLMGADNRKTYGDTKQIEVTQSISITAALEQARSRITSISADEVTDISHSDVLRISQESDE